MHRALALLCLLPALLDVRVDPVAARVCLAPAALLTLLPGPQPARLTRVCLPPHWPRPPRWIG